jgi:type I restriction enzyme S subunit
MKKGWEIKYFEDCLDKVVYTEKIQRKDFLEDGEFPVVSQEQEFINGYWNDSGCVFKIKKPVVIFGDHTQVLKYVDFDFVLGADGVKILQPVDGINAKYFYYFLNSVNLKSLGYARHYRLLKEIQVPIPSLPEQQRIVALLDETFSALETVHANAERNQVNAREVFEVALSKTFQSTKKTEEKKLGEVSEIIMGQSPDGKTYNSAGNGVPLINGPVEFGQEAFSKTVKTKFTTSPTKYCKENDLIVCVRGSTTGRTNIAGFDACIGRGVAAIRNTESQTWINYFILSARKKIYSLGTGATFPNVSSSILADLVLPFPPLAEQRAIVKRLDELAEETKRLEEIYAQKSATVAELKKSILQKAFEGELL